MPRGRPKGSKNGNGKLMPVPEKTGVTANLSFTETSKLPVITFSEPKYKIIFSNPSGSQTGYKWLILTGEVYERVKGRRKNGELQHKVVKQTVSEIVNMNFDSFPREFLHKESVYNTKIFKQIKRFIRANVVNDEYPFDKIEELEKFVNKG